MLLLLLIEETQILCFLLKHESLFHFIFFCKARGRILLSLIRLNLLLSWGKCRGKYCVGCWWEASEKTEWCLWRLRLLRLQETGTPFPRPRITRRRLRKEAPWGHMYWQLQRAVDYILCQASTIYLNWKQWDCWLLTWGPVANVQWTVWVVVAKLSV